MSIASGPKVVTDGLIFSLDMKNKQRSWKGKPTVNYIGNGSFAGGLGVENESGSYGTYSIVQAPNPGESPYVLKQTAGPGEYEVHPKAGVSASLNPNTTYCMSLWVALSPDFNGNTQTLHSRWYDASLNPYITAGNGYVYETQQVGSLTWERRYETFTTPATTGGTYQWYIGYPTEGTTGYRYITGIQLEEGSFPSPFVNGSRTSTQAIVDLTNNSPINIVAMTYNSDGTAYFNGPAVGNWLEATENYSIKPGNSFTYEIMCKHIANAGYDKILLGKPGWHLGLMDWGGTHGFQLRDGGPTWYNSTTTYSLNTWYHLVGVYVAGTGLSFYRNGSLIGTSNFSTAVPDYGNTLYIGGSTNNNYSNGAYIDTAKVYNRALSATEISYNFEAVRSRYGI